MNPSRRRSRNAPPSVQAPADEQKIEALTIAMALAPGVYARNRMFDFFATSGVRRAKTRAATLRGVVKQLGRAFALTLETEGSGQGARRASVLRYQIPAMRLTRVIELSQIELAALRILAERSGASCLPVHEDDRALVASTLARLLGSIDLSEIGQRELAIVAPEQG